LAVRKKNPSLGVGNAFADSIDLRRLNPQSEVSLASTLAAMKRLFMDSEARFGAARSRWQDVAVLVGGRAFPTSPGPHRQAEVTAMSGHLDTQSDTNAEVIGTQFSPDAAELLCEYDHGLRGLAKSFGLPLDKSGLVV
jgi:hypothetical protein